MTTAILSVKFCPTCQQVKPATIEYFTKYSSAASGFYHQCKQCKNARRRELHSEDTAEAIARRENKSEAYKAWRFANKEKAEASQQQWRSRNQDRVRASARARAKKWRTENPEKEKAAQERNRKKRMLVASNRIHRNIGNAIRESLNGKKAGVSWQVLVGYTLDDLRIHLQKQFSVGMGWGNYGPTGWHIDHITPQSSFHIDTAECAGLSDCWALSNLRPLWAKENIAKGARLTHLI